ncbi:hypothetical protein [Chryseolinea lacunae]|uniref:SprT-like domain-containing protein n=1 Tax=Chryseolinea lacunae TaxID=2801331 RepID=A0ABS1KKH2_9BACT|nr:hypothetical protein [Chryseolinea lacunae]MBL0739953.1 hypothetical protein [Chryseolinea lacunae]
MNRIANGVAILFVMAFAFSCEDQSPAPVLPANGVSYTHVAPQKDANLLSLLKLYELATATSRTEGNVFDSLAMDDAVKVINPERDITRYSLLLHDIDNGFENLVVRENDSTVYSYILRYEPDPDWLASLNGVFDSRTFTGTLVMMEIDRRENMRVVFDHGAGVKYIAPKSTTGRDDCDDAKPGLIVKPNAPGKGPIKGGGSTSTGGGGGGGAGGGGGGGGSNCHWSTYSATGGLIIDCPGIPLLFFLRTACDGGGATDSNPNDSEDPIGVLPPATLMSIRIKLDTSVLNNPKALCIYNALSGQKLFRDLLKDFTSDISPFNLTFKLGNLKPRFGQTEPSANYMNMVTTIDRHYINVNGSLLVAKTFLHESIHARLYSELSKVEGYESVDPNDFPKLFDAYSIVKMPASQGTKLPNPTNYVQHQIMAKKYVDVMAKALWEFDVNNHDNSLITMDNYRALAWQGLRGTQAYHDLTADQRAKMDADAQFINLLSTNTVCQ